jgi:molybdopterin-guanine dinucleotide biosynthesis protein A
MPDSAENSPSLQVTAGILLAGGRSRRMGGGDKSLVEIGGVPMLARAISALRPQCDALLVSANGDPGRFSAFGLPVVADDVADFAGPLAGILAGLDFAATYVPEARFAVSIATDTPFLPSDLVARLHAARRAAQVDLACARSGGRTHPIVALWPVAIRTELRRALCEEGEHKIERFLRRYPLAYAEWPVAPYDPFLNINAPADVAEAEEILAHGLAAG